MTGSRWALACGVLFAAGLCMVAPQRTQAGPLTVSVTDTPSSFLLTASHGPVDSTDHFLPFFPPSWVGFVDFTLFDFGFAGLSDVIVISGTLRHIDGPHPGEPQADLPGFIFNYGSVLASAFTAGTHVLTASFTGPHGTHVDDFEAVLSFVVSEPGATAEFDSFTLTVSGNHIIPDGAAVPAPGSLLLLALGALGLGWSRRKRQ